MTPEEFQETVDFGLVLNEWAATQPGYKSPVTVADVEEVMAKVRPALKKSGLISSAQDKLKYSVLVQIIKQESPRTKLPMSNEVTMIKDQLLKDNLLTSSKSQESIEEFQVTDLGRRFVQEFERNEQTEKQ